LSLAPDRAQRLDCAGATVAVPVAEQPGDHIGRYTLRETIGEGGCGIVFVAEQEEPVRREVALKIIKLGMDTKEVMAWFEAERQALALMDHPNIARVFDGGATGGSQITNFRFEIHPDLDWIVMKCLEKNRARRYETANGLAQDIEAHLNNQPVTARPPSTVYRVQKLVRRNKLMVTAGAMVAMALVLGVAASTWQAVRATRAQRVQSRERQRAEQNEQKALEAQAKEAAARRQAQAQAYASEMKLAQEALAIDNLGGALELLNRHRPQRSSDLRGWEWRYLWDQCRGDPSATFPKTVANVFSLAIFADGKWLAVGEFDTGAVSISDLRTQQEAARLAGGDGFVRMAFSPIGPLLAFSCVSGGAATNRHCSIRLWDMREQRIVRELPLDGRCCGLAFSGDGRTVVTFTDTNDPRGQGQIALWRLPEGRKVAI